MKKNLRVRQESALLRRKVDANKWGNSAKHSPPGTEAEDFYYDKRDKAQNDVANLTAKLS